MEEKEERVEGRKGGEGEEERGGEGRGGEGREGRMEWDEVQRERYYNGLGY